MKTNIEQKVAESQNNTNTQIESCANSKMKQKQSVNCGKNSLTPYQKYKNSRNQNGKKYFEFYDDIKVYTHNIYDW